MRLVYGAVSLLESELASTAQTRVDRASRVIAASALALYEAPHRLAAAGGHNRAAFAGTMRMTWSFEPHPDGTLVAIACENVPSGIRPEDHDVGLRSSLDNLAAYMLGRAAI